MLVPCYTRQFERDVHLQKKRCKNVKKLREIMTSLIAQKTISPRNRDHKLVGQFKDYRECHIEPDWLLIYKIQGSEIYFVRTGTHSDLFE